MKREPNYIKEVTVSDFYDLLDMYNIEPGIDAIDELMDAIERECEDVEEDTDADV